ncbi:MAG: hypothetical protein AAF961_16645, partial [Planctomycetota bacterium]
MTTLKVFQDRIVAVSFAILTLAVVAGASTESTAAERLVMMEKFSASWCPHCATASEAIDMLLDSHGDDFITLDAFSATSGRYATDWGVDRAFNFYSLQSYPTTVFDGLQGFAGAPNVQATYDAYRDTIEARAAAPTDVAIGISAVPLGGNSYDVTMSAHLDADGDAKTLRLYLVQALDDYGSYDSGSVVPHNTLMQTIESNYDVALTPGQTVQFTQTLELDETSA